MPPACLEGPWGGEANSVDFKRRRWLHMSEGFTSGCYSLVATSLGPIAPVSFQRAFRFGRSDVQLPPSSVGGDRSVVDTRTTWS